MLYYVPSNHPKKTNVVNITNSFMSDFYLLERFNFQIIQRKSSEKNMIRLRSDRSEATGATRE